MARAPEVFSLDPPPADAAPARQGVTIAESPDAFAAPPLAEDGLTPGRTSFWRTAFWSALSGFVLLVLSVSIYDFIAGLMLKWPPLAYAAMALAAAVVLALLVLAGREVAALLRLGSAERMRKAADAAFAGGDAGQAKAFARDMIGFYAGDVTTARGRTALEGHLGEIIDAADLVHLTERELLKSKDDAAREAIASAASKVAMVTTISPRAWFDIAFVVVQSFRLISRIAAIYSGRPGGIAIWRLSARVATHLAVTGGIAVAHDAIGQFVGAGLVARLSSKLGEGVLNGVLTARVGLSAIAVCRPMPFRALTPPALSEVAGSLLKGQGEAAKTAG